MILASSSQPDKTDPITALPPELEAYARCAARNGTSLHDFERALFRRLLALGKTTVDLFVNTQGDGDLGPAVTTEDGVGLHRSATIQTRRFHTIFGEHSFEAFVYSRGPKQKIELRPLDARLNLPAGSASYLLQDFTQLFCVEKAFGVGAKQFEAIFGQKLSVAVLEDINREMDARAETFLEGHLSKPKPSDEGEWLVLTADGKGVPLVKADAERLPAFEKKERPGNRRMATLGCLYSVDRFVRTPEQIVAALFRNEMVAQPTDDRPEPVFKQYRSHFAFQEPGEEPIPGAMLTWSGWRARRRNGTGPVNRSCV